MINLNDFTFTIPARIDSPQRLKNLYLVLKFLLDNFETNIHVWEDAPTKEIYPPCGVKYTFVENSSPTFHRTKILNDMAKECNTPYLINYDADVIMPINRYAEAVALLRSNEYDVVYPYNGVFIDIKYDLSIIESLNTPEMIQGEVQGIGDSTGGAIFWNKTKLIEIGMQNENFISWGAEDREMFYRATAFGLRIKRLNGPIYHIDHPRGVNSNRTNPFIDHNDIEYYRMWDIIQSGSHSLGKEVTSWSWVGKCGVCGRNYNEPCGTIYCASHHGICGVFGVPRPLCKCQTSVF